MVVAKWNTTTTYNEEEYRLSQKLKRYDNMKLSLVHRDRDR